MKKLLCVLMTVLMLVPQLALAAQNDFYIIPDSDTRLLTEEELWGWQYEAVGYIYNEIFARHGRPFRDGEKYDVFFSSQAWYEADDDYRYGLLNHVEVANERLAHQVLHDMRAQKTLNMSGKPLPKTDLQAQNDAALTFRAYRLKANQRLAVYTGPGKEYVRAAKGKAVASTNGDIRIAGSEDEWLLIEYEIDPGKNRVGYTPLASIKGRVEYEELEFDYTPAYVFASCKLTDDPNGIGTTLAKLKEGTAVTVLCYYRSTDEDWAYVEADTSSGWMRGFIPEIYVVIDDEETNG